MVGQLPELQRYTVVGIYSMIPNQDEHGGGMAFGLQSTLTRYASPALKGEPVFAIHTG